MAPLLQWAPFFYQRRVDIMAVIIRCSDLDNCQHSNGTLITNSSQLISFEVLFKAKLSSLCVWQHGSRRRNAQCQHCECIDGELSCTAPSCLDIQCSSRVEDKCCRNCSSSKCWQITVTQAMFAVLTNDCSTGYVCSNKNYRKLWFIL